MDFREPGVVQGKWSKRWFSSAAYDGGMESIWTAVAWSILPTLAVCAVFFFVLRGILRFDRTERKVHAQIEAEERAARGMPPKAS